MIESVMRLNGWQRLWVVLTTGWTLCVAGFMWSEWPVSPTWFSINAPFVYEITAPDQTVLEIQRSEGSDPPLLTSEKLQNILDKHLETIVQTKIDAGDSEATIGSFITNYTAASRKVPLRLQTPAGPVEVARDADEPTLRRAYNEKLNADLSTKRMAVFELAALWWLVPPLVFYAAGAAVGWIYRGFRQPPA